MGDNRDPSPAKPKRPAPTPGGELRGQVIVQAPAVFITLVSVLVGLVLSDLVTEARARMHLWPLDSHAVRTWGELLSNGTSAVSVWVVLANLGLGRRRLAHVAETTSAFLPPLLLLTASTFVGRPEVWQWLYGAGVFLVVSTVAIVVNVRLTMDQPDGARFARLMRPQGFLLLIWAAAPVYLAGGWLDQHGWLPPLLELALVAAPVPMHFVITAWFYNEWSAAPAESEPGRGEGRPSGR